LLPLDFDVSLLLHRALALLILIPFLLLTLFAHLQLSLAPFLQLTALLLTHLLALLLVALLLFALLLFAHLQLALLLFPLLHVRLLSFHGASRHRFRWLQGPRRITDLGLIDAWRTIGVLPDKRCSLLRAALNIGHTTFAAIFGPRLLELFATCVGLIWIAYEMRPGRRRISPHDDLAAHDLGWRRPHTPARITDAQPALAHGLDARRHGCRTVDLPLIDVDPMAVDALRRREGRAWDSRDRAGYRAIAI
jgi:hypothetical protein